MRWVRESTSESQDAYKAGVAQLLNRKRYISMAQWNADIAALSKSCMLGFKSKMQVQEAIDAATLKLRTFVELEAIRASVEYTEKAIPENEGAQDTDQRLAASVESEMERGVDGGVTVVSTSGGSIYSEVVQ